MKNVFLFCCEIMILQGQVYVIHLIRYIGVNITNCLFFENSVK